MDKNWRQSSNYKRWAKKVVQRDGCCIACGACEKLHAHHMNHATYCIEQRFWVKNGITLCNECHMNFHCNFKKSYRTKCDEGDLHNWLQMIYYILEKKDMFTAALQIPH